MLLVLFAHIWLFFALLRSLSHLVLCAEIWHFRYFVLLLYLLSGGVPNIMVNNYLENLLSFFTLFATYASVRAEMKYDYKKWLWYVAMALAIFLGYLTKGPVALFPLAFPFLWAVLLGSGIWVALGYTLAVFGLAGLAMIILFLNSPAAWEFMKIYHKLQVFSAILTNVDLNFPQPSARTPNTNGYFDRVLLTSKILFKQLLLPLGFYIVAILIAFWRERRLRFLPIIPSPVRNYPKLIAFFFLASLCASLPIMCSPTINSYYFMPSHSLYILGFSLLLLPYWLEIKPLLGSLKIHTNFFVKPNFWRSFSLGITFVLLAVCAFRFGKASRHSELILMAEQIAQIVPRYSQIYYEEEQMPKLSSFYVNKKLGLYDGVFNRYSGSVLVRLSEVKYATPKYLLLHSSRITHYADALKVYTLIASFEHGFQLYEYRGS